MLSSRSCHPQEKKENPNVIVMVDFTRVITTQTVSSSHSCHPQEKKENPYVIVMVDFTRQSLQLKLCRQAIPATHKKKKRKSLCYCDGRFHMRVITTQTVSSSHSCHAQEKKENPYVIVMVDFTRESLQLKLCRQASPAAHKKKKKSLMLL